MTRALLAALLSLAICAPLAAQTTAAPRPAVAATPNAGGPAWNELQPSHQRALAPLRQHWAGIDADRKSKWIAVAQRFGAMPQAERDRVQARMAQWAALSPAERGSARQNFQELRNLPAEDRQALWEAYNALPAEQKQALAQRARPAPRAPEPTAAASTATPKRNVAQTSPNVTTKPVTPTVVQAKPGATTTLVTKTPAPPPHHQPGVPKIAATKPFVNPNTLLPHRGPQGAATHAAAPASGADARP